MITSVTDRGNERALLSWRQHLKAAGRSSGTVGLYDYYLRRFLAGRGFAGVSVDDVEVWLAGHDWKPSTARNVLGALASFYGYALSRGLVDVDPTARIVRPRVPPPCAKPTPDAVIASALLREPDPCYWLLRVAVTTGLRRGELAALHSDQVERHADGYWLRVTGKGGVTRLVPCPPDVADWLMAQHGWAFPSPKRPGCPELAPSVGKRLRRMLDGWSAHTLRHHYATATYQATGDLLATQQLLGHASPVTTQGYVQQRPDRLRSAAAAAWVA